MHPFYSGPGVSKQPDQPKGDRRRSAKRGAAIASHDGL